MTKWRNSEKRKAKSENSGIVKNRVLRVLILVSGWILVGMGAIGVILPLIPTTPFLLLAALCFYKSSTRFYNWLYANRVFGKYLLDYKKKKGIPVKVKIGTLLFMWTSLFISVYLVPILWLRFILIAIGTAVTIHLLLIRTKQS
ncbi:MAG: YbaN family protein [Bacteroidales bacterium]|nr:YbaN family protein [Bacteroidales bacterium]